MDGLNIAAAHSSNSVLDVIGCLDIVPLFYSADFLINTNLSLATTYTGLLDR